VGINELRGTAGAPVWLRNYYKHIFRDEADLARIRAYIERNPAHWFSRAPRLPSGLR
jgi:putative transposase